MLLSWKNTDDLFRLVFTKQGNYWQVSFWQSNRQLFWTWSPWECCLCFTARWRYYQDGKTDWSAL